MVFYDILSAQILGIFMAYIGGVSYSRRRHIYSYNLLAIKLILLWPSPLCRLVCTEGGSLLVYLSGNAQQLWSYPHIVRVYNFALAMVVLTDTK